MKKLLAIVVLGLFLSIKADAGTNNEGKNKKYVYKYLSDLKTIIKTDAPTEFKKLKFITQAGGNLVKETTLFFVNFLKKNKVNFFKMYGQTEASPRISYVPWNKIEEKKK